MYQQGFSLIELLMGLAIAAIVLPWAGASYKELIESIEREDTAQLLISGLRLARSEAITRNRRVLIQGIDNDWGQGWRIMLDNKEKTLLMERTASARVIGNQPMRRRVRFGNQGSTAPQRRIPGRQAACLRQTQAGQPPSSDTGALRPRPPGKRRGRAGAVRERT